VAATWSGVPVARTRLLAYVAAGVAGRRGRGVRHRPVRLGPPDAGTSGNGLALPAITIAVLGGVAITGGIGRVSGVLLAAVLITWLDAGILLAVRGQRRDAVQLLALGAGARVLRAAQRVHDPPLRRYQVGGREWRWSL